MSNAGARARNHSRGCLGHAANYLTITSWNYYLWFSLRTRDSRVKQRFLSTFAPVLSVRVPAGDIAGSSQDGLRSWKADHLRCPTTWVSESTAQRRRGSIPMQTTNMSRSMKASSVRQTTRCMVVDASMRCVANQEPASNRPVWGVASP